MDPRLFQHDFTHQTGIDAHGRLLLVGWLGRAVRVFLTLGLSLCAYLVFAQAVANWYSQRQTPEGFRKAIRWEPSNPDYYAGLARALQRPLRDGDLPEVISLYEKAIQLSPHDAAYWARLGQAYEWAGRAEDARNAYERARLLFPASPAINWEIGNFYLREGRTEQALGALQETVLGDPDLRRPAFDLAWRATGDGEAIEREMIPAQSGIYFEYLDYLVGTERLDEATKVWDRAVGLGLRFDPKDAFPYLDALIQQRRIDQLTSAWSALKKANPPTIPKSMLDPNLVSNGDFESEILNGGLDWRVNRMAGAVVSRDSLTFLNGLHSLRIRFDGKQNLSDALVFQYVPVGPNTSYRFEGYIRAQGITTDSDPAKLFLQSDAAVGNSSWLRRQLEFKSGSDTRLLEIRVARPASTKFDNRIAGAVWIDQVSLTEIKSAAAANLTRGAIHAVGP
jgi:tetratricopeptide (TPR) repeat protein